MPTRIEVFDGAPLAHHAVANWLARAVARSITERGWCHLALPGGPFVRPIFTELAGFQLPWSDVTFYFTDERCVPVTHPASNFGEAIDKLLKNPRIEMHQFRRIEAERAEREEAAEDYERGLPEAFDCLLAELGADGHIAALYPRSPALSETERLVLPVEAPTRPQRRISVTPPVLQRAREVLVVATGHDRAAALASALASEGDVLANPGRLLRERTWFADREAAAQLPA
ncbi:MAG TPA: 6-phosphogluconolactonase [Planctomycetota bacterium]|nr:6-phosphogluconolactonase [Planctomycetota bacterium]